MTMAERDPSETVDERDDPPGAVAAPSVRGGWVSLYAAAFVLMLLAGALLMIAALGSLSSIRLLWASAAFSVAAMVVAVAGVVAPRR